MTAKMKSKPFRDDSRPDWEQVKVRVMRWTLRVKLAQNWVSFGGLIESTGDLPIVESSRKDAYWGAKVDEEHGTLVGTNVLGRLLMELREILRSPMCDSLREVEPLGVPDALLYGAPIERVVAAARQQSARASQARQHPLLHNK